jgi:hypothetical protein
VTLQIDAEQLTQLERNNYHTTTSDVTIQFLRRLTSNFTDYHDYREIGSLNLIGLTKGHVILTLYAWIASDPSAAIYEGRSTRI